MSSTIWVWIYSLHQIIDPPAVGRRERKTAIEPGEQRFHASNVGLD